MKNNQQGASEEMILYARVLERGMYAGLILMFVTFFIYLFGIIDPLIPLEQIDSESASAGLPDPDQQGISGMG